MSIEKDFYQDVDTSTKYNKWRILVVLFWVAVFSTGFGAYYVYNLIKIQDSLPAVKVVDQDAKNIDEVISYAKTDPSFDEPITITQNELTSYLYLATEKATHDIKNIQVKIDSSKITMSGRLLSPVDTTIKYELVPQVNSGRVTFAIESLTIGQLHLSKSFIGLFGKKYIDFINNSLNQPDNLVIKSINLSDGSATVSGRFKVPSSQNYQSIPTQTNVPSSQTETTPSQ